MRRAALVFAVIVLAGTAGVSTANAAPLTTASASPSHPPVLAYYYIWFDATSWNRAKSDFPALGRYSSDERRVMEQHVRWAKESGIDGFLVSWKHTERLDRRLRQLADIAEKDGLKLSVLYQGLDFNRRPLPAARVKADLEWFRDNLSHRKAFDMFEKPLVAWSGTWEFSPEEIASVTESLRPDMLILASERNPKDFERIAPVVDGDAYYWSSVNPATYERYSTKLQAMSEAVHASGGLWIAPFAPGFDARLLGKKTVVERRDGELLREEWDAALNSSPDALGLISWNEFSENSHVEPSHQHGQRYLDVLSDITGAPGPSGELNSDAPARANERPVAAILALLVLVVAVGGSMLLIRRRQHAKVDSAP